MGPVSSPTRGSVVAPRSASVSASVRRKLDFSTVSDENSIENVSAAKQRAASALPAAGRLTTGSHLQALTQPLSSDNASKDDYYVAEMDDTAENGEDSFQLVNGVSDDDFQMIEAEDDPLPEVQEEEADAEEEAEPEREVVKPAKKGKRKSPVLNEPVEPAKKGRRGRPKKADPAAIQEEQEPQNEEPEEPQEEEEEQRPAKRTRKSLDKAPEAASKSKQGRPKKTTETAEPAKKSADAPGPSKKASGKSRQSGEASNAPKGKAKAQKYKLAPISEDSPAVQRGPPLPRNNRGLVILRRETPAEGTGFKQTRSGRNSIKPLAFWRNERVEYSEDETEDNWGKFLLPRIKEVVRTDEVDDRKPYRQKSKSKASKSKKVESEDEDEAEPWETQPGRIEGEVRTWDPEDPTGQNTDIQEEEIALSSAAIVTQVVKDGSFKFAKTLTLPFFGSGMLDLRPGDKKKAKYSRKMQMVFFVHYGRVQVTVNGDNVFRIGKGGMWQVPRGMFHTPS